MSVAGKRARAEKGTFLTTYDAIDTSVDAGTWTPNLRYGGTSITMADNDVTYYRVGLIVNFAFHFVWTEDITGGTSSPIEFDLPFARVAGGEISTYGLGTVANWQQINERTGYSQLGVRSTSTTVANFVWCGSGNATNLRADDVNASGTKVLGGSITYICSAAAI